MVMVDRAQAGTKFIFTNFSSIVSYYMPTFKQNKLVL